MDNKIESMIFNMINKKSHKIIDWYKWLHSKIEIYIVVVVVVVIVVVVAVIKVVIVINNNYLSINLPNQHICSQYDFTLTCK
jgi:hypothetical protein